MKHFKPFIAILLTLVLAAGSMPLCFAADPIQSVIEEDYAAYLAAGGIDESTLVEGVDYAPGEILFNYVSADASTAEISSATRDMGVELLEIIDQTALKETTHAYSAYGEDEILCRASFDSTDTTVFELCKAMNRLPHIKDCEPNYLYAPDEFVMPSEVSSPSSAYYSYKERQAWYFNNMRLTEAWQRYQNLGEDTVVCVIDNGLNYDHEEIKNCLWTDNSTDKNHGYNAEFNNHDIYGKLANGPAHGSHCAGIIAMQANNGGLVGVAPKTKIMMCNAVTASTGYFTNSNLIKSLEYAVANGADVISMSLGGYAFSVNMEKALTRASFSAVILCAAGNDALNAATRLHYPSASGAVIGVMALGSYDSTNTLSSYSNYDMTGRYYQVAAPGTDIYSIAALSDTGYVSMDGTSMATPFMAGIAALYVSCHPEMSPTQARNAIINAAGELVAGYNTATTSLPFKKATPYTLLGYENAAPYKVNITDATINAAVRDALHTSEDYALTNYDLECVTYLDLSGSDFENYSALSLLPSLTSINLSNTGLTDAKAQTLIDNLSDKVLNFDLSRNRLTNLDCFADYDGFVSRLLLSDNQLSNIAGISKYTMLSDLDISSNQVADISPVASLSGLVYLYAPGNRIEDPSPIINLTMLEEVYFGDYNPNLTDMFGELYFLSGSRGNRISSLEAFMSLNVIRSRLHYLNLSYNFIFADTQYHYRAAKLLQLLETIGKNHKYSSIFADDMRHKLVLTPRSEEELVIAQSIAFENDRNFATLFIGGGNYTIPFRMLPADANVKTGITFTSSDTTVVLVNEKGVLTPMRYGSAYITLALESGTCKTFFVTVKDTYVASACMLNPSSFYVTDTSYSALVYTAPCEALLLCDQNGKTVGEYTDKAKYCYNLTDAHGNHFQKWIVDFSVAEAGEYEISAFAYNLQKQSYSDKAGSFNITFHEKFGNTVSGYVYACNYDFDTTVSLLDADKNVLQTLTLTGGVNDKAFFSFSCVPDGTYSVKIERDGYKPYYISDVLVEGDTFVDDDVDITSCAGDFNGDAVIDIGDISLLLLDANYAKGISQAQNYCCDIDADQSISIADLAVVLTNLDK